MAVRLGSILVSLMIRDAPQPEFFTVPAEEFSVDCSLTPGSMSAARLATDEGPSGDTTTPWAGCDGQASGAGRSLRRTAWSVLP